MAHVGTTGHDWETFSVFYHSFMAGSGTVEEKGTHKYWRSLRRLTEPGISPEKWLLERPSVLSFVSLPISAGIRPLMLLFCSRL